MGKKMKLIPFLYKPTEPAPSSSSWPWPNCGIPKTLSFRDETLINYVHVTTVSTELSQGSIELEEDEYIYSWDSFDQSIENVIRGARSSSERLFFDNHIGESTSCILGDHHQLAKSSNSSYMSSREKRVVLMEMESRDPYDDFKKSMEEMVEASGFNMKDDWDSLDQLLSWYLKANCKSNHGYIVGAFIDLLLSFDFSSASNSAFSSPTPSLCENDRNSCSHSSSATVVTESLISDLSFSSNCSAGPCLSTLIEEEEDDEDAGLGHQEENN